MKRSTALRHLVELAEAASERLRFRSTELGWPLDELWVALLCRESECLAS